jgi:hypothetical protein
MTIPHLPNSYDGHFSTAETRLLSKDRG